MKSTARILLAAAAAASLASCAVYPDGTVAYRQTNATQGAGLGAAGGAILGAIIGHQSDDWEEGALLGAAIGGLGGYAIGNEKDKYQRHGYGPAPYGAPPQAPYRSYGVPK